MQAVTTRKSMRGGEVGLTAVLAVLALACLYAAAKTIEPAYAFHMALGVVAAAGGHLRHLPALFGAVGGDAARDRRQAQLQFRARQILHPRGAVLGRGGHGGGHLHRLRARLSLAQHRALVQLRPPAAAAHLGGDLRLRRQRAARDLVLCRAAHLPRPPRRRSRAVVRRARLQHVHRARRDGLPARRHRRQGIRRAGMVRRPVADHRLGHLSAGLPRRRFGAARSRTSTSPTGSISPSS